MPRTERTGTAAGLIPPGAVLDDLRTIAAACTACHLHENATQTVFGEGSDAARMVLVGEQPGDQEDLSGRPFVGPAGQLLDRSLQDASIDRDLVYVTNVVKHFKWRPAGKRRIHQKPNAEEVRACRPWLEAELDRLQAPVVVALGATAAQALLGPKVRVTVDRGRLLELPGHGGVVVTVHPSSILRERDGEARRRATDGLVTDLVVAREALESG